MKILKNIFLCNYFYIIILVITFIHFFIYINLEHVSLYKSFENEKFVIEGIKDCDYKIKLDLRGKEKVIGYLYDVDYYDFLKEYSVGDKVFVSGEDIDINNVTVNNTFDYKKYLYNNKIYHVINIFSLDKVENTRNIFYKVKDYLFKRSLKLEKSYSYINSLLLGDNSFVDEDVVSSYRNNGISHLFAISGLHVSFFFMILRKIFEKLRFKKIFINFLLILFLIFYMFLTNYSPSILRAGLFNILLIVFEFFKLKVKSINILILVFSIIVFINPLYLFNLGLQFSFVVTFSLLFYNNLFSNYGFFLKSFFISFLSFIFAYPITISNFFEVNFLSIVLNIFFVPYVSYILLPFCMISFIFPFLDNILFFLINIIEVVSLFLEHIIFLKVIMCKLNLSIILFYYVAICLILSCVKRRKIILLFLFLISFYFMHFFNFFSKHNFVYFFDINQGDSALINVNGNVNLIDTGGVVMYNDNQYTYNMSNNRIIPFLKSFGIRKIDNLILTHGDYDHMGEAINLVNNFKVEKVIFNCGEFNELEQELIKVLDENKIPYYSCIKELNVDNNKLYFLQIRDYGNENDNSSVIYTELNNYKFLFMGDAGIEVEADLIRKYNLQDIDVLKVGHHGSKTSSSKNFINNINPKYSIISVGKNNRYGHPNKEVLDNLEKSKIYRTDKDGSIMFKISKNKLEVEICAP